MTKAVLEAEGEDAAAKRGRGGSVAGAQAVPASLHASLMARLDRLGRREDGGADRRGDRAGIFACALGPRRGAARAGAKFGARPVFFSRDCCRARARRRRRPISSSTPSCRTLPTARCCASLAARCTPESRKPLKASSPRSPRTSRSCWRVIARRLDRSRRPRVLWGKAGQRSLARSALVEAAEQLARALAQIAALSDHAGVAARANQATGGACKRDQCRPRDMRRPKPKQSVEQARMFIEHTEALGEPLEDPLHAVFRSLRLLGQRTLPRSTAT